MLTLLKITAGSTATLSISFIKLWRLRASSLLSLTLRPSPGVSTCTCFLSMTGHGANRCSLSNRCALSEGIIGGGLEESHAVSSDSIFALLISSCARLCVSPILSNAFTAGPAMSRHVSIYKVAPSLFHTSLWFILGDGFSGVRIVLGKGRETQKGQGY